MDIPSASPGAGSVSDPLGSLLRVLAWEKKAATWREGLRATSSVTTRTVPLLGGKGLTAPQW